MSEARRSREARRQSIEQAYDHAVAEMQPDLAVRRVLGDTERGFSVNGSNIAVTGRLMVMAVGKAAAPMANAAAACLRGKVDEGFVLTKDGHLGAAPEAFAMFEAAHPVPDQRGIDATRVILQAVESLSRDDVVLALISGGGSALLESPRAGLALADIQQVTDLLLRAGAPIQHLNAVRSELSEVKGGGLRRAIGQARVVSLILSDVLGNDPEVIASGPTIVRQTNPERAIRLLNDYALTDLVPAKVSAYLSAAASNPDTAANPDARNDVFEIIGDNAQFVAAVRSYLEGQGLSVGHVWSDREGEARDQAVEWVNAAWRSDTDAVIGGGELTVTVRGDGVGGRNTEFVLAAVSHLASSGRAITVASLASDGQDGGADAAGASVDESSEAALRDQAVDIGASLGANDSATALESIGALVTPGPTGTNVNDVYIAVRG